MKALSDMIAELECYYYLEPEEKIEVKYTKIILNILNNGS